MVQAFTSIVETDKLADSRQKIMDNLLALLSSHAGTSFPTHNNCQIGMFCFRTDLLQLFQLMAMPATTAANWKLVFDLNKTATNQQYVDSHTADVTYPHGIENNGGLIDKTHNAVIFSTNISISGNSVTIGTAGAAAGIVMNVLTGLYSWFTGGTFTMADYTALCINWDGKANAASPGVTPYVANYTSATARPHHNRIILLVKGGGARLWAPSSPINDMPISAPTAAGNKIWHAGNVGAGSGLNADLLDGYHASSFLQATAQAADSAKIKGYGADTAVTANTAAIRDANGDIAARYIKSTRATENAGIANVVYDNGDGFMRRATLANFKTALAISSGIDLNSNITVTASTETAWSGSPKAAGGSGSVLTRVDGIGAGTYTLQNVIQQLVTKSHTHGSQGVGNSNTNCTAGDGQSN